MAKMVPTDMVVATSSALPPMRAANTCADEAVGTAPNKINILASAGSSLSNQLISTAAIGKSSNLHDTIHVTSFFAPCKAVNEMVAPTQSKPRGKAQLPKRESPTSMGLGMGNARKFQSSPN